MRSVRLQFVTVGVVNATNWWKFCLHSVRLQSIKHLVIFVLPCAYANNLLPHAQGTLTICYRMRRVRLQFVTVCAVYASKADHRPISPFYLNQVKTYEKSENSKKAILAHSNELQRILKQLFFVLAQSQKSLSAYTAHTLTNIKC